MKILLTIFVLLISSFVSAEECLSGDCVDGYGVYEWDNGSVYIGENINNDSHGSGILLFGKGEWEGDLYTGEFINGFRYGKGTYVYANGDIYTGEYKNHKKHGVGTYIFGPGKWKGDIYQGEYKNGSEDGIGTYFYKDGDKYVGEWKNGEFHGEGTYIFADGEIVKGTFKNGQFID